MTTPSTGNEIEIIPGITEEIIPSVTFREQGQDLTAGYSYDLSVIKVEVAQGAVSPIEINGLNVHYIYHYFGPTYLHSRYTLYLSGEMYQCHREALRRVLHLIGVPLTSLNHTLHLMFDSLYHLPTTACHETMRACVEVNATHRMTPTDRWFSFDHINGEIFLGQDEDGINDYAIDNELNRVLEMTALDSWRPTPASRDAIDALETVTIIRLQGDISITETSCSICLVEFPFGSQATRMPCSHTFHRDCIVTWLQNRSSCPLCRFNLPSSSSS